LCVGQIIALPAEIQRWLIYLYSAYASDNKLIIYRFRRGVLWGMYKKGLGPLWAEKKETSRRLVLLTARRVPDV